MGHATPTSTVDSSVRALGMGDAFTGVADDWSALFYNPAGLARVTGINWHVFDLNAGIDGMQAYSQIQTIEKAKTQTDMANAINGLYGKHIWVGAGGQSIFSMPMIAFGVYNHTSILMKFDDPVNPQIYTDAINDYGYIMGLGVPLGPLQVGADLKYIKRSGMRGTLGAADLADLSSTNLESRFVQWGRGYGADAGINLVVPAPFFGATFSAVWKNIGQLHFRSDNNSDIPWDDNDITLGMAFRFSAPMVTITPAVDYTNLNRTDLQLTRKLNFGIEFGLPLLDIRAGFHEGYYALGLGVNMGLFQVDAATYGVELGEYTGQIEDRRYVVQFSMELGFGDFSATGSGKNGSGSRGAFGSQSDSFFGGGFHLKQRR